MGVVYGGSSRGIGDGHLTASVYFIADVGGFAGCALRPSVDPLVERSRTAVRTVHERERGHAEGHLLVLV